MKLKGPQLTTQVLAKVFGLFPDTVRLLSDDGYVETPDANGRFTDVDDTPVWTVSGNFMKLATRNSEFEAGASSGTYGSINSHSYQTLSKGPRK